MKTRYFEKPTEEALSVCARLIREGKLVAFPTETVYGLGADARNTDAVAGIFAAKGREGDNPLIVHFASAEDIADYAVVEDEALFRLLADRFMPGPLTVVLKRRENLSPRVSAGLPTVAVRVPSHPVARELILKSGCPIAAPSANRSHRPSPTTAAHVLEDLEGKVDALLNGGPCLHGVESTVLLLGDTLRLLRPGAVTREMIEEATGRRVVVDDGVLHHVADREKVSSPGMKYRHYAPKAPLIAVLGEDEAVRSFFLRAQKEGSGILCYEEDLSVFDSLARVCALGKKADYAAQAEHLFDALRRFDSMKVEKIYTRLPSEEGIGLAVKNRLLRACEFEVIEVKL